jgi:hypothetical protein
MDDESAMVTHWQGRQTVYASIAKSSVPHRWIANLWTVPKIISDRGRLNCNGKRAENRFRLSAKRTSPFKSDGGEGAVSSIDYWQPRWADQVLLLVVMLDRPRSEVVWRVLVTHFPSRPSPSDITFQLESTNDKYSTGTICLVPPKHAWEAVSNNFCSHVQGVWHMVLALSETHCNS